MESCFKLLFTVKKIIYMKKYTSIKQLVIDQTISNGEMPPYETLTKIVLENFPNSKWKETHYAWYKSKINTGKFDLPDFVESQDLVVDQVMGEEPISEFAISIERDLQNYISSRLTEIEDGLTLVNREYKTDAGFIDILCKDSNGDYVVIETKAGRAKDAAVGQLLGYIGALKENGIKENIRGILVASDFENRTVFAAKAIGNMSLKKYSVSFSFEGVH